MTTMVMAAAAVSVVWWSWCSDGDCDGNGVDDGDIGDGLLSRKTHTPQSGNQCIATSWVPAMPQAPVTKSQKQRISTTQQQQQAVHD